MLKKLLGAKKGQSFTELAVIVPILLFVLIGGVEVGWALRSYLILGNVNREVTRFAVRPGYLDFSDRDADSVGYDGVLSHVDTALADQLPLDFSDDGNSSLIIHHVVVDTGYPCPPDQIDSCDCSSFTDSNPDGNNPYTLDDAILYPGADGYEYFKEVFPENSAAQSKVDYDSLITEMTVQNNTLNCKLLKQDDSALPSVDNLVITEIFYSQPQLLGFPIISNVANPVNLYSSTSMRLAEGDNLVTQGPVCAALPITFHQNIFPDPNNPRPNVIIDAFESDAPGNFGWLYWEPDPSDTQGNTTLVAELNNPRMSMTNFTNAQDPDDHNLSVGDWVDAATGVNNSSGVMDGLEQYIGKTVLLPVHDNAPGTGTNANYHVSHFARVVINNICLPANNGDESCGRKGEKRINATFLEYADDACYDPVEEAE